MTKLQTTIKSLTQTIIDETLLLGRLERQQKEIEKNAAHEWKHGDVFLTGNGTEMVYIKLASEPAQVFCVGSCTGGHTPEQWTENGKFLFNIREKL